MLRDRESGVFTDPAKVHGIGHEGEFFKVPGIHLCEPSPQRSPVIYQAGASSRGRQFAAEHAEAIFTAAPTKEQLAEVVGDIRGADEGGRPRPLRRPHLHPDDGDRRRDQREGLGQARRARALRLRRGRADPLQRLDGDRPRRVRPRRPDRRGRVERDPLRGRAPSSRPTTRAASGRSATSPAGAGSAASARGWSARPPKSPTRCRSGSRSPTSTASTSPTRSPPAPSSTWSST